MVAILDKGEHNSDFHPMVDFLEASPLRRNLKLRDKDGISSLPDAELFENLTLMGYYISLNQKFTFQKGQFSHQWKYLIHTIMQCLSPKRTGFNEFSSTIATALAQEVEILKLKERVKVLEDREGIVATRSEDDVPIKGKSMDEGEAATERISDDTEEMATVLTSIDAATVLAGGIDDVPTGSGSIPTAGPPATDIPTGSEVVPTASPVFATATVVTPYSRRKGKEVMVESNTPKKQRLQEQIDAQVVRELKEQQEREDKRMSEQIARDAEVVRIHAEEELQSMIDGLDRNNESIAKYLQEYQQFAAELPLERRIELISDLVKYQENYAKIYKFQSQQRRSWTKKQKMDYYMAVIRNNLGWKVKDFKGMTFEEVEAKFNSVYKQMEYFIPMGSKEKAKRYKRKAIRFDQESSKKLKSSEEVIEEAKSTDEIPKEQIKEMMQLIPIEEVYVEAL
nr:hypothetical protein [Tanacetum cinerariifolium]